MHTHTHIHTRSPQTHPPTPTTPSHQKQGEERAYLLSKVRRLHREQQLLAQVLEMQAQGALSPTANIEALLPPFVLARLTRGEQPPTVTVGSDGSGGCSGGIVIPPASASSAAAAPPASGPAAAAAAAAAAASAAADAAAAGLFTPPPPHRWVNGGKGLDLLRRHGLGGGGGGGGASPSSAEAAAAGGGGMGVGAIRSPLTPATPGCLPRVESEEEEEGGLGGKGRGDQEGRDDATAAARYVVEEMRYDVFVALRELLALSSSAVGGGGGGVFGGGGGQATPAP
jgi:hypothetical protein